MRKRIPARETVAGEACLSPPISKRRRMWPRRSIRSLEGSVKTLLSSMTVLSDSIHSVSMSPSRTIHLGSVSGMSFRSRMILENRPSVYSFVTGLENP